MNARKIAQILKHGTKSSYVNSLLLGLFINFAVEALSRKSLVDVIEYGVSAPLVFLYNSFLISATLSIALLFRRRVFFLSILSVIWIAFGFINSVLLVFRTTPFTAVDFLLIKSAYSVMWNYLTMIHVAGALLLILLVIAAMVYLWNMAPKHEERIHYPVILSYMAGMFFILHLFTIGAVKAGVLADSFGNIGQAFLNYGFPYGFSASLVNTGIEKPEDYSIETVDRLVEEVMDDNSLEGVSLQQTWLESVLMKYANPSKTNVIFLQLESFFDPYYVKNVTFSEDPIPIFRGLKENYTSGFLSVPSIGAGTANTEFEILTGMCLDFFGPGEYPYKTVLQGTTCESLAYDFKELGYTAHAIHNNEGTFYGRNLVFSQLGFDRFSSMEYMEIDEYTPMGWPKDKILTNEILKALDSTKTKDVIYTISVQGHGSYPDEIEYEPLIYVTGMKEPFQNGFQYYVNQIHEMDQFVEDLLTKLSNYHEPVMVVLYGDHLPTFDFVDEELENSNIFQTEYVIWSNKKKDKQDRDLEAFQLSSYVMEQLGLHGGMITRYHRIFSDKPSYMEGLELLEYDMLYGDMEVFGGVNPYRATQLQMGILPITISNVSQEEENAVVYGQYLTEYSKVLINGEEQSAQFVDHTKLVLPSVILSDQDEIVVQQIGKDTQVLSQTPSYWYSQMKQEQHP